MAKTTLTTSAGAPIADNQNSITAGPRGPVLLQDYQLIEKLAHQNRERIPERPVHAKGWGAYGTLTVTNDLCRYSCAKVFSQVGKKTDLIVRFSTVAGAPGLCRRRAPGPGRQRRQDRRRMIFGPGRCGAPVQPFKA